MFSRKTLAAVFVPIIIGSVGLVTVRASARPSRLLNSEVGS
jgi:hypothetical protein